MLDLWFLESVREVWAGVSHVSFPMASEAESLFETLLLFFQSKLFDFYCVDVHGIGVFSGPGGRRKGLEGLDCSPASLSNLLHMVPLVLEVDGF